jgi:hypothetical protein
MSKRVSILSIIPVLLVMLVDPVYAYLDPGSGSMILQLLLAGLAGLVVVVKIFWRRILSILRIGKKEE